MKASNTDYVLECDCYQANGRAKKGTKEINKLMPVPSRDGETCDYCGYYAYRHYKGEKLELVQPTKNRKPVKLSAWHLKDES